MTEGQTFLCELAALPADTYEHFFARCAAELQLGLVMDRNDLRLLYEASFTANACNLALNRECACAGAAASSMEARRTRMEYAFMAARDLFYASPGWQNLASAKRISLEQRFLQVAVRGDLLAW